MTARYSCPVAVKQAKMITLLRTLNFNMPTEACRVWDASLFCFRFFCSFSEHYMVWPWSELAGTSTPGKTGNSLNCLPLLNSPSCCRMMDFKLFGNGLKTLPRLIGSNNCFLKINAVVFSYWLCDKTQMLTLTEDQIIKCIWLAVHGNYLAS